MQVHNNNCECVSDKQGGSGDVVLWDVSISWRCVFVTDKKSVIHISCVCFYDLYMVRCQISLCVFCCFHMLPSEMSPNILVVESDLIYNSFSTSYKFPLLHAIIYFLLWITINRQSINEIQFTWVYEFHTYYYCVNASSNFFCFI
jgi:hypothetical protein